MFDDTRLPEDIERGATGGPEYSTTVITLGSGREQRNQEWEYPLHSFNVGYGIRDRVQMEKVYAFFKARAGKARGFRFKDWLDFKVKATPVALVTGEPLKRQLVRVYEDTVNPQIRLIGYPVLDTLKVYVNQVLTTAYTVDGGVLTFTTDPGNDVIATFEYDIPVRFDIDRLDTNLTNFNAGSQPSIQIVELRV